MTSILANRRPGAAGLSARIRGSWPRWVLWLWFGVVVVFLFAPIATAVVYSFNAGVEGKQTSAFTGWSLAGYRAAVSDPALRSATATSLVVAFWSTIIAVLIGSVLGYELVRHPRRWVRRLLAGMTYVLLIIPETVIGVSLLVLYSQTHVPLGTATLISAHTPLSISVVAFIVRARLLTLDRHLEEAAADLGAGRLRTLGLVVLPQLGPAIGAAALLAYTFSFDNVVVSNFLSTPRVGTLPVYLYGTLQYGPTPALYAAASMIFVATLLVLAVAALVLRTVLRARGTRLAIAAASDPLRPPEPV